MVGTLLLAAIINVAPANPRYFADESGKTWIPIGCNVCFDILYDGAEHSHAAVRANFDRWLRRFAANAVEGVVRAH